MTAEDNQSKDGQTEYKHSISQQLDALPPESLFSSSHIPYNKGRCMNILFNRALLDMNEAWESFAEQTDQEVIIIHQHFQMLMNKLKNRGLVNETRIWLTNAEEVDILFVGVAKKSNSAPKAGTDTT